MKAVIYARVSTNMQAERETPILGQIEECKQFAASQNWEVVGVYKDEGFTGRNAKRPGFQDLIQDAGRKKFDKVIVWKGSRIARDVYLRLWFEREMQNLGVDVYCAAEPRFEGPEEEIITPMMAGFDAYLSRLIGQGVKRGLTYIASQGYSTGGRPPRGYVDHREVVGIKKNGEPRFLVRWEPDPLWRDRVVKAFRMVAEGRSNAAIIEETGIVSNKSSLCTLFRNPTYIGERVFNVHRKEKGKVRKYSLDDPQVIRVPEAHEAIIPLDLWNDVQVIMEKRRPQAGRIKTTRHCYPLSDILWCTNHDCGVTGFSSGGRKYYMCEAYRREGKASGCKLLKKEPLEAFIIDVIKDEIYSPARIKRGLAALKKTLSADQKLANKHTRRIKADIKKQQAGIDRLYQAVADGHIGGQDATDFIDKKKRELAQLEQALEEEEKPMPNPFEKVTIDDEFIVSLRKSIFDKLSNTDDPIYTRAFLSSLIQKIKLSGPRVTIHLKTRELKDELPDSCLLMVAGVGFEPTTSGL